MVHLRTIENYSQAGREVAQRTIENYSQAPPRTIENYSRRNVANGRKAHNSNFHAKTDC